MKNLIIEVTNGEGYSSPVFTIIDDSKCNEYIENLIQGYCGGNYNECEISGVERTVQGGMKIILDDGDDNHAIFVLDVHIGLDYLVTVNPNECELMHIHDMTAVDAHNAIFQAFNGTIVCKNEAQEFDDEMRSGSNLILNWGAHLENNYLHMEFISVRETPKQVGYKCPECGSENVNMESYSEWDKATQEYIHNSCSDTDIAYCENCGNEGTGVDWEYNLDDAPKVNLNNVAVINAPGVTEHLKSLGFCVFADVTPCIPALWITNNNVDVLDSGHQSELAKFMLPADILATEKHQVKVAS